ncbi:hypothetical protein [Paraferrimonas sedimenticola]|uniref:Uncharacterized protein n=1 Tax=Paraferrimonas sedimenticola TaxID=375674 RepID=A0AA37RW57_9GAMM|nr:hypothetical protein [Paraferrimonas sedimenticola]GLP96203.1 hypothetical protein GCM10007895_15090 [Paraferrimonas sedimenticola]
MSNNLSLEDAVASLDQYQLTESRKELANARTLEQMKSAIDDLNYSEKRLQLLAQASQQVLDEHRQNSLKQQQIQTYKTKIINLSRELNMSYQDVIDNLHLLDQQANKSR